MMDAVQGLITCIEKQAARCVAQDGRWIETAVQARQLKPDPRLDRLIDKLSAANQAKRQLQ